MTEADAMTRALDLAWRGWGRVQPNPMVGAVLLQDGEVVGEGYHAEYGGLHAEPVAIRAAGARARGATLLVTLEPCPHHGKQPPCTDAIREAGIARVVAASPDPMPVSAGGAAVLRDHGIPVELGLQADAAARQNAMFFHRAREAARPFVALKLATSLDGRIADRRGKARWISAPASREYVQWLRAGFDAIGVGGHTARTDNPELTVRGAVTPRVAPHRVVFDKAADLDPASTLVRTARAVPTVVVTGPGVTPGAAGLLEGAGVSVLRADTLTAGLGALHRHGIGSMLVEGGGRLAGALLAAGLVDRFYWIQSPIWLGDGSVPAIAGLPGIPLDEVRPWTVIERRALGPDTLLVLDRA